MLTLESFKAARNVLQAVLRPTPLIHSPYLSKGWGNNVYLKPENMQATGAYKLRGAYYKISTLTQEEDRDKLSLLGAVYYLLQAVLWTAALVLAVSILAADPADRQGLERLYALLMMGGMGVYLLLFLLSWLDYDLGRLLFGE